MKTYFVVSDIHGFHSIFYFTLIENGFDINNKNHIIIICGDVFDRGNEAKELLDFLLSIPEDRLVLIRGNHEDLLEDCLAELKKFGPISHHHWSNGTISTIGQLTDTNPYDLISGLFKYEELESKLEKYFSLVNRCVDYYELDKYVFVHGWVPVIYEDRFPEGPGVMGVWCEPIIHLDASKEMWESARWKNGMQCADLGIIIPDRTIVCGHWHTGWGHYHILKDCDDEDSRFDIYYNDGVIALDACTALSKTVNILKIEVEDDK